MKTSTPSASKSKPNGAKRHKLKPHDWAREYGDYLLNYATQRLPDSSTAEDVVQESYMSAWKGRHNFRGTASERTWLTSVLRSKIAEFYRRRSRRPMILAADYDNDSENPSNGRPIWDDRVADDPDSMPDLVLRRAEFMSRLRKDLKRLPDSMREAFWLREVEGLSNKQVAQTLGISPENLCVKIHRAKRRLRRQWNCQMRQI